MRKRIIKGQNGIPDVGYYTPWSGVGDITQREYFLMNGDGAEMFHRNQDEMMRATASLNGSPAPIAGIIGRSDEQIKRDALEKTMTPLKKKSEEHISNLISTNLNNLTSSNGISNLLNKAPSSIGNITEGIVGLGMDAFGMGNGDTRISSTQQDIRSGINNLIGTFGGVYGKAFSAIAGAFDAAGDRLGWNLNNIGSDARSEFGMNRWQNGLGAIPLVGNLTGAFVDNVDTYKMSDQAKALSGAWKGTTNRMRMAEDFSGGNFIFGNRDIAQNAIDEAMKNDNYMQDQYELATNSMNNSVGTDLNSRNQRKYAFGAKEGMKLPSVKYMRELLNKRKTTVKMQNGGEIPGIDSSVIPDGKLHKELNHLDETNLDADVTKKGIPVVQVKEGGELEQVAEIEKEELVLTKSLTTQIEALMEDGSEEAMIEAGKLLATELIENTEDFTGNLIEDNGDTNTEN